MTGIGRLRALAYKKNFLEPAEARELDAIADQIEREQGGRVSRTRVLSVVTDMERHVLGAEGMGDSPVARWARELREALGGNGRDPAADVSVSACDLLPQEDREAIAWVREHGGLDRVKAEWRSRVPYDLYERRRRRLLDHIAECETALGRRNVRIDELGCRVKALTNENAELRRRAIPEGMEWPRYESGEPVRIGDVVNDVEVRSVVFRDGGILLSDCTSVPGWGTWRSYKERVKRPAVPAGDGEPLEVGQTVWDVYGYGPLVVKAVPSKGEQLVVLDNGGTNFYRYPEKLTHERPESKCRDCAHWQKDPTADNMGVCWFLYHEYEGQDCYSARLSDIGACEEFMPSARALAERERGE